MALNWKEIDLILSELALEGSVVRQIFGPDHNSLVFDLYRFGAPRSDAFKLFISLSNPHCRLHKLYRKLENPKTPLRFTTFLRARIRNSKILSACQVQGERIIKIVAAKGGQELILWVRLWASAANIIVTDLQGKIVDVFYRRPKRGEMPGHIYDPILAVKSSKQRQDSYVVSDFPGTGSFNQKVAAHYFEREQTQEQDRLKKSVARSLLASENRIMVRIKKLQAQKQQYTQAARFREQGDLIKSSLHVIKQGDQWLETSDYFNDGSPTTIELDAKLPPAQNAEFYYNKYRSAKRGGEKAQADIDALEQELARVSAQSAKLTTTTDLDHLRGLVKKTSKDRQKKTLPGLVFNSAQYQFIVGRTSSENDNLLRKHVKGNDYWFHSRDYPGAYVFIRSAKGKSIPLDAMLDAGNLAIYYSKGRNSGQGDIYYTQIKHLRRVKGGKTGLVIPTSEKNLFIKLDSKRLARLKKTKWSY